MNQAAIALLTKHLPGGLIHPGDPDRNMQPTPIPLPGLSNTGIPPEMAQHFANQAGLPTNDAPKLLAEAIVHCIETELYNGEPLPTKAQLDKLREQAATTPDGTRIITIHCTCDTTMTQPLLELTIGKNNTIIINGKAALQALAARNTNCPHQVNP